MNFIDVLFTVVFLILLAAPGYIFAKLKMLPEKAAETISTIVLYCCQSVIVITSFQKRPYDPTIGLNMLYVGLFATAVHMIMFAILKFVFVKKSTEAKIKVVKYASVYSNCGFMGFPFLQSLFSGEMQAEVMIYGAVIVAVFNLLNWTFGVYIMTGDKKQVSPKKIIFNPVIISLVIGFLLFIVLQKPLVELAPSSEVATSILVKFMASMNYLADMVTPCSMIVIGIRLANVNIKQLFLDRWAYVAAFFKLIIMPVIAMLTVAFFPVESSIKYTVFFLLAMPAATSTTMFAVKFNADADFASVCVLLSTVLSVVTIPLMYLAMSGIFGVTV